MKSSIAVIFLLLFSSFSFSQTGINTFPLSSVHLLESPFKKAQETDLKYMMVLDPDKLLAPFLIEAGIDTTAKGYGNWEGTGLNGHIGGHYLSALSNMYAATGNEEVGNRLSYMIDKLEACQRNNGDGYVGGIPGGKAMWQDIANGKIDAGSFSLNGKWVPLYNIHKLFAGLIDAYSIAGNSKAKLMLVRLSDWFIKLTAGLTDEQIQRMLRSEHGGMNEAFADVASITGENKYFEMARRLSHQRILFPLLHSKDSLTGMHANTQIPKVIGFMRIANMGTDTNWARASDFFWRTVVEHRSVSIGGNSVREHFHPAENFSSMIESKEGPETCNSYNMLKLSKQLFLWKPSAEYINYYEKTLYNHILSSQHPRGGFVYFTPMRPRHYRVYSQPELSFWCCVGSGMENHGKYGELIYAHDDKNIYVNLFIASKLEWKEKGIRLVQNTKFPSEEMSTLKLTLQKPTKFALYIRYPAWVKQGEMKIRLNNREIRPSANANSYAVLDRIWKTGDVVSFTLPMHTDVEYLPDGRPWVSFLYGPLVLAAATDSSGLVGLRADDSRMGHIANGPSYPMDEAPLILTSQANIASGLEKIKGKPLAFRAPNLIHPASYKNLELVPFYKIHDARYMIYWQVTDNKGLEKLKKELKEKEKSKLALEALTLDQLAPGEQQPESDHGFKGEKTESGSFNDRSWRNATGWFSYNLKNKNNAGKTLRITYFGKERSAAFDIYLNDKLFKTVTLDGSGDENFFDVDYDIPEDMRNSLKDQLVSFKFSARSGSQTARIFYLRLLQ